MPTVVESSDPALDADLLEDVAPSDLKKLRIAAAVSSTGEETVSIRFIHRPRGGEKEERTDLVLTKFQFDVLVGYLQHAKRNAPSLLCMIHYLSCEHVDT